ncbi:DICT sensory domain-containing protein [Aphanothece sacrum]|nr:DICT sensory domain-containing protein [Aphanothece sacrum]
MNISSTPELSLYQLAQSPDTSLAALSVRATTFRMLVETITQLLLEQQISATLWVKLPPNPRWWTTLEAYQQEGLAQQIYRCNINRDNGTPLTRSTSSTNAYTPKNGITPIVLEASSQLKREYFCLILSPQLCSLILAQEQIPSGEEPSSEQIEPSLLKLIYSFEPSIIQRVLTGIRRVITITDTTPPELLADSVVAFPLPQSIETKVLNKLLYQHLKTFESQAVSSPSDKDNTAELSLKINSFGLKDDFINALTRELSIPLTNMKTALSLLDSMQHKREPRKRYLNLLQEECDRQNSLITGLQELAQLNQPLDERELSVKLEDVVPGIVSIYQPIAEEKGIILGYTIPAGFPPVACPHIWLKQILRNLLNNSLKFTHSSGRVNVQAILKSEAVELVVSDTGIGIENSDLPKVFESFYRGRNASTEDTTGPGLGLAIVHHLVERCGGTINVNSYIGKGTVFKITLPIAMSA